MLVGNFNPAIFHPEWLLRHKLISEDDNKGANVEIVHNQVSKFNLEWVYIDVLHEKMIARTNDSSYFEPMRDLMLSVLKILEHMPITQMGINLELSYAVDSEEIWHQIGDALVPKKYWRAMPERVGMKAVEVQSSRNDNLNGHLQVKVTPLGRDFLGVRFSVNNHIELSYMDGEKEVKLKAGEVLNSNWESLIRNSRQICEKTLKEAIGQ